MDDDLFKRLIEALEPGMEFTITVKKPPAEPKKNNVVKCPHCGWKHTYSRHDAARRGWDAHIKSCKAKKAAPVTTQLWVDRPTEGENNREE